MNDTTLTTRTTEIVLPGRVESSGLQVHARDLPAPAAGQAVLRMDATGVSFAEQQMRLRQVLQPAAVPVRARLRRRRHGDRHGTRRGSRADRAPVRRGHQDRQLGVHQLIDVADLVPVPDGVDAADAETVVVNGITAWQMLHRTARVRPERRSWSWAPTVASGRRSCSWPATPGSR